jgi:hypothetical protein
MSGLTLDQVLAVVQPDIPTDMLGDLLRRLPPKYFDQESKMFRPLAPAILLALDLVDEREGCDERLTDLVETVAYDPSPTLPAWSVLPDGSPFYISKLLDVVAQRLAGLYSSPKPRKTSKKTAPVA